MSRPEGGHAGPADAVLDDREQRAVAELLNRIRCEIRRGRIHPSANLGTSAAVASVTDGTVFGEMIDAATPGVFAGQRIRRLALRDRNRETDQPPGDGLLDPARPTVCCEAAAADERVGQSRDSQPDKHAAEDRDSHKLHGSVIRVTRARERCNETSSPDEMARECSAGKRRVCSDRATA